MPKGVLFSTRVVLFCLCGECAYLQNYAASGLAVGESILGKFMEDSVRADTDNMYSSDEDDDMSMRNASNSSNPAFNGGVRVPLSPLAYAAVAPALFVG